MNVKIHQVVLGIKNIPKEFENPAGRKHAISIARQKYALNRVFSPHCAFTGRTIEALSEYLPPQEETPWFLRSRERADGAIVTNPKDAVVIFNADCPIVSLFDQDYGRLAVLHAGLPSLLPLLTEYSDCDEYRSIMEICMSSYGFAASSTVAIVGCGIGPCCYGIENRSAILKDATLEPFIGKATRGARKSQPSLDLYELIRFQLETMGIPKENIQITTTCTSCAYEDGEPLFHSNIRPDCGGRRNATISWFETV